jgi:hypothetical protein
VSATSTLPPAAGQLLDFADRWPPMVVKELRQGLRAKGFVFPFLALHVLVLGAVAVEFILTNSTSGSGSWASGMARGPGVFWVVVYLVVAGVMPLRLMESLQGESEGRNTELLLLGGLTRWQIVRGKWQVQAVLTLLSLLSLLPYMLVRYFFGGVELVQSLFSYAGVLFAAFGMSGCVIGASGYASLGWRFFIIGSAGVLLGIDASMTETIVHFSRSEVGSRSTLWMLYGYSYTLLFHVLYAAIGLQLGRAHLKLFLAPYEISPTRGMMAMFFAAPFMLIAGAVATCGYGALIVLGLVVYTVCAFDRTPKSAEWAARKPGR